MEIEVNEDEDTRSQILKFIKSTMTRLGELMVVLSQDVAIPFALGVIIVMIELIQYLALFFNEGIAIPWHDAEAETMRSIFSFMDHKLWQRLFGASIGIYIASVATVSIALAMVRLAFLLSKSKANVFLIRLVRGLLILFSTVLFIPTLFEFASGFASGQMAVIIISSICAPILLFLFVFAVFSLHNLDPASSDAFGRSHSLLDFANGAQRGFLVFLIVLMKTSGEIAIFAVVLSSAIAYYYTLYPPYFDVRMDYLRGAAVWGQFWITLSALIAAINNDSHSAGSTFVLASLPLVCCAAFLLIKQRCDLLINCPLSELTHSWTFDFRASILLRKVTKNRSNGELDEELGSRRKDEEDEESMGKSCERDDLKLEAKKVLNTALQREPESVFLLLQNALFAFRVLRVPYIGYGYLNRSAGLPSQVENKLHAKKIARIGEGMILANKSSRDITQYNEYHSLMSSARQHDLSLVRSIISFWEEVLKPSPNPDKLRDVSTLINKSSGVAQGNYEKMFQIYGDSVRALRLYAGFLMTIIHDKWNGQILLDRASDIEDKAKRRRRLETNFRSALFCDDSSILTISAMPESIGQILQVNSVVPQMFGTPESSLHGKNVKILIPEPFASIHDAIMIRNLNNGINKFLDQRRSVVMLHRSGFIMSGFIFVKLLVHDMTTLSLLGVIEGHKTREVILIVRRDLLITGISQSAVQRLHINKQAVDNREKYLTDIIPDFSEQLEKYRLGAQKDEHYRVTLSHDVDDRRLTMKSKFETYHLLDNNVAYVVRLSVTASVPIPSDDEDTPGQEDNAAAAEAAAASNKVAVATEYGSESESESSEAPSKGRRVQMDLAGGRIREQSSAATKKSPSEAGETVVSSNSNQSTSISESDERHRKQEQVIFSWLRRSTLLALLLVCLVAISGMFFALQKSKDQNEEMREIDLTASRGNDLISIAHYTRELDLLRRGFVDASRTHETPSGSMTHEKYVRNLLKQHAETLAEANRLIYETKENWSEDLREMYDSPIQLRMPGTNHTINYKTVSVLSALMLVPPKAMQIFSTPLADISPSNDKAWFLMANAGTQITDKVMDLVHLQEHEADVKLTGMHQEQLFTGMLSLVAIVLLCLFALRPAVTTVLNDKDAAFLTFFDVPLKNIYTLLDQVFERLALLDEQGDEEENEQRAEVDANGAANVAGSESGGQWNNVDEAGANAAAIRKMQDAESSKVLARRKQAKLNFASNSTDKAKDMMTLLLRVGMIFLIYLIYFGTTELMLLNSLHQRLSFSYLLVNGHEQQTLVRRSTFFTRELALNRALTLNSSSSDIINSEVNSELVIHYIDELNSAFKIGTFGNDRIDGSFTGDGPYYELLFENLCPKIPSSDCENGFLNGIGRHGFQLILFEYLQRIQAELTELHIGELSEEYLHSHFVNKADAAAEVVSIALFSQNQQEIYRLEDEFIKVGYHELIATNRHEVELEGENSIQFSEITLGIFIILNIFVYFGLSLPLLESLNKQFNQSRELLSIIPVRLRFEMEQNLAEKREIELLESNELNHLGRIRDKSRCFGLFALLNKVPVVALLVCIALGWAFWGALGATIEGRHLMNDVTEYYEVALTMVLSSFVGASTPVGSGAIAVAVLYGKGYGIDVARDFSFLIQCVGMLTASLWLILSGVEFEPSILKFTSIGAVIGTVTSMLLSEGGIEADLVRVILAAMSGGFVIALILTSFMFKKKPIESLSPVTSAFKFDLVFFGLLAGIISGLTGSSAGFIIFSFCRIYFRIDDRIGTATAIIIMTLNSFVGVLLRLVLAGGLAPGVWNIWFGAAPVAALFGPIGAWVLSQTSSNRIQMSMSAAVIFQLYWIVTDVIIHDVFFILLSVVFVIVWSSVCVVIAVGGMIQSSSATPVKETR